MPTDEDDEQREDEEIGTQPGDDLATTDEIRKAIRNLYRDVSTRKRLVAVAALIVRGKPHLKRQFEPEDLFQEALERIGRELRVWPKNRVDFPGLVIGVMKSWSHSLEKKKSREDDGVVMEHELTSADRGDDAPNLEETASDSSTPLDQLEAQEHDAKRHSLLAILKAQFGPQKLETKILETIMNASFETHEEIRSALGVGEADYRNAWKVLMRAAKNLEPKE